MSRRIIAQHIADGMVLSTANIYFTAHDNTGARVFRTAPTATPGQEAELCHEPACRFVDIVFANVDGVFYGHFFALSSGMTTIRRIPLVPQPGQVAGQAESSGLRLRTSTSCPAMAIWSPTDPFSTGRATPRSTRCLSADSPGAARREVGAARRGRRQRLQHPDRGEPSPGYVQRRRRRVLARRRRGRHVPRLDSRICPSRTK